MPCGGEVVGAFGWIEGVDGFAGGGPEAVDGSLGGLAERGLELGGEATSGAAKTPAMSPPLPSAAQWCARMLLLSIICRRSASPPPSAKASSITSHRRDAVQRRNWRNIEFQLPNSAGRSRHGAPVRPIRKMASSTRRWLRASLPPRPQAGSTKGPKKDHSSSVSSPRINADLRARDRRGISSASGWDSHTFRLSTRPKPSQCYAPLKPGRHWTSMRGRALDDWTVHRRATCLRSGR